eukprot:TRINITY_DN65492_c0_g1_i1.p1 TRINITY_DN65492_c0_g1~~TRINITY_DN65492_c0_g1_i1.p1  ORF type:complete len:210 (-),score=1.68 TRINITY_DN65492_c0_g1_i1:484-1113(-)
MGCYGSRSQTKPDEGKGPKTAFSISADKTVDNVKGEGTNSQKTEKTYKVIIEQDFDLKTNFEPVLTALRDFKSVYEIEIKSDAKSIDNIEPLKNGLKGLNDLTRISLSFNKNGVQTLAPLLEGLKDQGRVKDLKISFDENQLKEVKPLGDALKTCEVNDNLVLSFNGNRQVSDVETVLANLKNQGTKVMSLHFQGCGLKKVDGLKEVIA